MNPESPTWVRWSLAFTQYCHAILAGNYLAELYWRNKLDKVVTGP